MSNTTENWFFDNFCPIFECELIEQFLFLSYLESTTGTVLAWAYICDLVKKIGTNDVLSHLHNYSFLSSSLFSCFEDHNITGENRGGGGVFYANIW